MFTGQTRKPTTPLEAALLRILETAPASGHVVVKRLHGTLPQVAPHTARAAYLGLHRLERRGLLSSEWRAVPGRNLTAKCYRVTSVGVRNLSEQGSHGEELTAIQQLSVLVVLAIVGTGTNLSALSHSRGAHLTMVVSSRVPVSWSDLRRASVEVTGILGAIGVDTDWAFEDASRPTPVSGKTVAGFVAHVVIVGRVARPPSVDAVTLGMTPPGGNNHEADIFIFQEHIRDFAQLQRKALSSVLALVIAHEIGHALLPFPAHTTNGIMQAEWDHQALDQLEEHELLFSAHQGELIRQKLSQCCSLAAAR